MRQDSKYIKSWMKDQFRIHSRLFTLLLLSNEMLTFKRTQMRIPAKEREAHNRDFALTDCEYYLSFIQTMTLPVNTVFLAYLALNKNRTV